MRAEDFVAPNGRLWSDIRKKKPKKALAAKAWSRIKRTTQKQRRAETLKWRAKRKLELWQFSQYEYVEHDWKTLCGLCGEEILYFEDCELDHKIPVRRGGDTDSNTHLVHTLGNRAKASMSLSAYLAKFSLAERQAICQGKPCPKRERA